MTTRSRDLAKLPEIQEEDPNHRVHYHAHKHVNLILPPGQGQNPRRGSCLSLWSSVDNNDGSCNNQQQHPSHHNSHLEIFKPVDHNAIRTINGSFLAMGGQLVENIGEENAAVLLEVLNTIPKEDLQLREEFVGSVSSVLDRFAKDKAAIEKLNNTITEKDKQLLEERLAVAQKELERLKAKKLKTKLIKLCSSGKQKKLEN